MKARILLVDDEDDIRTIAQMCLQDLGGFETVVASSGPEALEEVGRRCPDAILLDMMMPGMDGMETLARLREITGCEDLPIIFMTARSQRREIEEYLSTGAVGVITKPFDPMALAGQVSDLLGLPGEA
ncbi:MAG: response regulator [Actinobacteria bacterium]|nr:response regulator [Actinomycetota bacterium]